MVVNFYLVAKLMIKKILHIGKLDNLSDYLSDSVLQILVIIENNEKDATKIKSNSFVFPIPCLVYNYKGELNIDVSGYNMIVINSESSLVIDILKLSTFKMVHFKVNHEEARKFIKENYPNCEVLK